MSFASELARLPDGNNIEYMDSGHVPYSSSYKTLVLIHGSGFNGHIFDKLMPLAASRNLRLIVLQRRAYSKSTPYMTDELLDLSRGDIKFFDRLTVMLGHFINYLIQKHDIPVPDSEHRKGGITVVGWSIACATVLTLLSDANLFPPAQYDLLQRYLTDIIFYDPPHIAFGIEPPQNRGAIKSRNRTAEDHYRVFKAWVSSYYDLAEDWDGNPDKLDYRPLGAHASLESWGQEEWEKIFEADTAAKIEFYFYVNEVQDTLRKLVTRNLFSEQNARQTFPNIRLTYCVCWRAAWHTPWAFHCMHESVKQRLAQTEFARPIRFEIAKEANHFWHYDCPEDFLTAITNWIGFRDN